MSTIRIHIAAEAAAGKSTILALVEDALLKAGLTVNVAVDRDYGHEQPTDRLRRAEGALLALAGKATVMLSEVQLNRAPTARQPMTIVITDGGGGSQAIEETSEGNSEFIAITKAVKVAEEIMNNGGGVGIEIAHAEPGKHERVHRSIQEWLTIRQNNGTRTSADPRR